MVSLFLYLNVECGILYKRVEWYLRVSAGEGRIETDGRKVFSPHFNERQPSLRRLLLISWYDPVAIVYSCFTRPLH
jgi:hypothetical protein